MIQADADRINGIGNLLELKRGMARVRLEQGEVFICKRLYDWRKLLITKPEARTGEMLQSGVQFPAA